VTVSCIISHRAGHSEENSLSARHDTSGNKNPIQALGSAVTYLQRYTLKAAVGVAAAADDDGQTATPEQQHRTDPEKIMAVSRRQPSAKPYRAVDDPKPLGEKQQELKDLIEKYVLDNNLEDTDKATIFKEVTMFKPKDPKKNPFPGYDKFDFSKLSDVHAASALRKFNEAVSGKK
jgi:hypothetical protein